MNDITQPQTMTPIVITQYEKLQSDIVVAAQKDAAASFDYRDHKQNKQARSHVFSLRAIKGDIEKARKEAKAYALDYGRRVDTAAGELSAKVEALILPHETKIKEIEAEEAARKAKHQNMVDSIIEVRTYYTSAHDSAQISGALRNIKEMDYSGMEEYKSRADSERFQSIIYLEATLAAALAREQEAAELTRLRAEAKAREEADRMERIQREAVERERTRAAEQERQRIAQEAAAKAADEARAKAEADRIEREHRSAIEAAARRELELKLAQEKAERERVEAIRRAEESERREKEYQARMEADAAEKKARREAQEKAADENRNKVIRAIKADLPKAGDKAAEAIINGNIRHVRIDWENQ